MSSGIKVDSDRYIFIFSSCHLGWRALLSGGEKHNRISALECLGFGVDVVIFRGFFLAGGLLFLTEHLKVLGAWMIIQQDNPPPSCPHTYSSHRHWFCCILLPAPLQLQQACSLTQSKLGFMLLPIFSLQWCDYEANLKNVILKMTLYGESFNHLKSSLKRNCYLSKQLCCYI